MFFKFVQNREEKKTKEDRFFKLKDYNLKKIGLKKLLKRYQIKAFKNKKAPNDLMNLISE